MLQRATGLLSPVDFVALLRLSQRAQRREVVLGTLQEHPLLQPLLRAAEENFPVLQGQEIQQVLLRLEENTGRLHHDLNFCEERTFSLLFYVEEPERGGEILFPFFDAAGRPRACAITRLCQRLEAEGTFVVEDPALEAALIGLRGQVLTIRPRANGAILFRSPEPDLWHFVCPVEAGRRACVVVFYRAG